MARAKNEAIKKEETEKNENNSKAISKVETNISVNVNTKNEQQEKSNNAAWIFALVLGAILIIGAGYAYNSVLQKNILKEKCNEYSNSPELKYPTVCVPLVENSNAGDYVDQKSDPRCRCKVDLGDGNSTIIDVRVAK
ncbi:Uncharacterised protein [uncultured archaeon]|nr:Uncharacterised protein [uncultured archaeon]